MAAKEMVGVIDKYQLIFARQRCNELSHLSPGAVLVVCALNEELAFVAVPEIGEVSIVDRDAHANEFSDSGIAAANAQANPASEAKTGKKYRDSGKFRGKKINGGLDVALLTQASVVCSRAEPSAAKIKPKNGNAKCIQRLGGLIDDLVVERASIKRVRVANDCREQRGARSSGSPQDGFQTANGALEK